MTDILFPDVSNFQNVDWPTFRRSCGAVASQTSWGTLITSPAGRVDAIRAQKFDVVIWYMGLVASEDIPSQVLRMYDVLGPLQLNETACIDWEATNGVIPTPAQRDQALEVLAFDFHREVSELGLYASASLLQSAGSGPAGWRWAAGYGTSEPSVPHSLWQFTNGQYTSYPSSEYHPYNWPGIGSCDTSVFHGTTDQMKSALSVITAAPPSPAPQPTPTPTPKPAPTSGGNMATAHEITLPAGLDANGNGWYSAASLGITDVNLITSVSFIVAPPSVGGYKQIPRWGIDSDQQFVVEGGIPGGKYGVILWLNA